MKYDELTSKFDLKCKPRLQIIGIINSDSDDKPEYGWNPTLGSEKELS